MSAAGTPEADIILELQLPDATVRDPDIGERLRREIAVGHAKYRNELRIDIKRRGKRTVKGAGSVNALALQARAHLSWDRDIPPEVPEPDIDSARERLRKTLEKLAKGRTEIEGRAVTWDELLRRQARQSPGAKGAPDA